MDTAVRDDFLAPMHSIMAMPVHGGQVLRVVVLVVAVSMMHFHQVPWSEKQSTFAAAASLPADAARHPGSHPRVASHAGCERFCSHCVGKLGRFGAGVCGVSSRPGARGSPASHTSRDDPGCSCWSGSWRRPYLDSAGAPSAYPAAFPSALACGPIPPDHTHAPDRLLRHGESMAGYLVPEDSLTRREGQHCLPGCLWE